MAGDLEIVLERSRALGFLGPGELDAHVRHATAMAVATEAALGAQPARVCDLGSGGGVPGLVLAARWPAAELVLLEAGARRCAFLRSAIQELGVADQVAVAEGRAESLARQPGLESAFPAVLSRSFGPPAVTAECGVRLLTDEGVLVVAEPPGGPAPDRWPPEGLNELGLGPALQVGREPSIVAIRRSGPCPPRYPRRDGVPAKRPLF